MKNRDERESQPGEAAPEQRELRYCRRCGALRVVVRGEPREFCAACARALRWIHGEVDDEPADL